ATWIGTPAPRSRTAARPAPSSCDASVTTAAASSRVAPAATALATESCSAVSVNDGRETLAPAYVRPSESRTAAPSTAPIRARAARASVTSFASSWSSCSVSTFASGIRSLPLLLARSTRLLLEPVVLGAADQYRLDPVTPAGGAFGHQPQPPHRSGRARDRHAAQRLREQPGDRVHLLGRQLHLEQLAQVLDRQPAGDPHRAVLQPLDRRDLHVVLVGDLPDDLFQDVLDRDQAGGATVLVHTIARWTRAACISESRSSTGLDSGTKTASRITWSTRMVSARALSRPVAYRATSLR